jgi:filamentous hemagglutinin family protein
MKTALFFTLPLCLFTVSAAAQEAPIAPDGTLPTEVNSSGNLTEITGGAQAGGNLFHSFSNFSVPNGGEAFFNNAADINNIISRVTGGKVSSIDGLIRANGSANLFLLNPAGIVFGPNASLNIGGSFLGSTADSLAFPEGEFSATNIQKPLLTINAPIGLNFRDNPQPIIQQSRATDSSGQFLIGFQTQSEKNISLVGGDINLDGGIVFAPAGKVNLGGLSAAGQVKFDENGSLIFPDGVARGNVSLTNGAFATVTGERGGDINITASNIQINGNSGLLGGTFESIGKPDSQSGDINLNATGTINLDTSPLNVDTIDNQVQVGAGGKINITASSLSLTNNAKINNATSGTGNAGDININTGSLSTTQSSQILAFTSGQGSAGNVNITARDRISFDGRNENDSFPSGIFTGVDFEANGKGGDINIDTGSLSITNRAQFSSGTDGVGDGGNIFIKARDEVSLVNSILISEVGEDGGVGKGGDINIDTNSLILKDGSALLADTENQGDAGNITINARDRIVMEGKGLSAVPQATDLVASQITSTTDPRNVEIDVGSKGGNISISTGSLSIADEGFIKTSTFGKGDAGNVTISASQGIQMTKGGFISSGVEEFATGNAGGIDLLTKNLSLTNGSYINASTFGEGDAGNTKINASDTISIDGNQNDSFNGIASLVGEAAQGKAGGIDITAKNLSVTNGGVISAETYGEGDAGNLTINVKNFTVFNSKVSASTWGVGDGGNLTVNASDSVELSGDDRDRNGKPIGAGGLFTDVSIGGQGNAGNLTINTKRLSVSDGSKIQASTFGEGNAGDLTIRASDVDVFETPIYNVYSTGIFAEVSQAIDPDSPEIILAKGKGNAGNLTIETERLKIRDGGQVSTSTYGEGNAGILTVKASDSIEVSGRIQNANELTTSKGESFLAAEVKEGATGKGGSVKIETGDLKIANEARISVASLDESGTAGNLDINADSIQLDRGTITAATSLGEGGNINLNIDDRLTMRNNSSISAQASNNANGGNITINAPNGFIVAFPNQNNDIIATADRGKGGQITINAQSIYGFDKKNIQSITDTKTLFNSGKNDINSTSGQPELNGKVNLSTQAIDPVKRTAQSSQNIVEPDATVAQACDAEGTGGVSNSFTITGRGGMPADPTKPLNSSILAGTQKGGGAGKAGEAGEAGEAEEDSKKGIQGESISLNKNEKKLTSDEIIPARGVAINEKGQIVLTRYPTPNASDRPLPSSDYCSASSTPEKLLATNIENEQTEETLDDKTVEDLMNFLYSMSSEKEKT